MSDASDPADELSGTWRAAVADDELRRAFADPELDDGDWDTIPVPGHWRSVPAFADSDGPLLYRRRFATTGGGAGGAEGAQSPTGGAEGAQSPTGGAAGDLRTWLVLDGLFYQGDVWLDGAYLGDTEGYFSGHAFEISDAVARQDDHLLAVEVTCSPQRDRTSKRNITGVFQHWDCLDPDWNPGGVWRPVRLERTGPVRIRRLRLLCREATAERAIVRVRADLESDAPRTVAISTTIGDHDHAVDRVLAEGHNWVEWEVTVDRPNRWWPRALGAQPMYDVTVEVALPEAGGAVSHRRARRMGLRQVAWHDWIMHVNGERLFLKGANQGPSRMALAEATPEDLAGDVRLAVDAGLDLLRLHGHISRPELYEAADEAGLLLWQDFPLQWGYARGIRRQAAVQAHAAVDLLGHHPSVVLWCGHNEPLALDMEPGADVVTPKLGRRYVAGQQLPSWNRTVLDRTVKRAFEKADGTRPVVAHSGVLPHVGSGGTDTHVYFGWYHGDERDLPAFTARFPRLARFVSEFGAQAVPTTDDFLEPQRWPDLDWAHLQHTHSLQKALFDRHVPPARYDTFAAWRDATQEYQATVVRRHVEHLRRLKYRPSGGFAQFCLADAHPAVTWSVVDHRRVPKAGYRALTEACAPVIVVADRLPASVAPGDTLALDVHVVSDLRHALDACVVEAELSWPGDGHTRRWEGAVPADGCVRVGTLQLVVPDRPGELVLDLRLTGPEEAENRYTSVISPVPAADARLGRR